MVLLHRLFHSNFLQFYFYNSKVWLLLLPVLQLDVPGVRLCFFFFLTIIELLLLKFAHLYALAL